ncbi:cytochrome P450 [Actinoplanes sp. SE50]|nr:CypC [Actinoplanes sp. SE50/110]ATO83254.1 cytochrome P450 [Actinoplanes sp. SE50]SLM00661.1 cytochrome P450 [Actinoplanes sp. SE50/110]
MLLDDSVGLAVQGYGWLPTVWRRAGGGPVVQTRLLGQKVTALRGPEAVRFFYDESHIRRHGALPEPVQGTLFGKGAVHTLDGDEHHARKAIFLNVLKDPRHIADLVDRAGRAWDETAAGWTPGRPVVLFDEASRVLTRAVCDWAGVPVSDAEVPRVAADLTAMVDGFATLGPRHWRARTARGRRERWLEPLLGHSWIRGLDAVDMLNILRPTVAVSWFVAFAGHALHRWPRQAEPLRDGNTAYAIAFAHEVRRFYPFAPFVGGRAVRDLSWGGHDIPAGSMVLLDIYGQNHDADLFPEPYRFNPARFLGISPQADELIPQGGGDAATNHRCPGEDVVVMLLADLATRLARCDYSVPEQDLTIPLTRIPARPCSGVVLVPAAAEVFTPAG